MSPDEQLQTAVERMDSLQAEFDAIKRDGKLSPEAEHLVGKLLEAVGLALTACLAKLGVSA